MAFRAASGPRDAVVGFLTIQAEGPPGRAPLRDPRPPPQVLPSDSSCECLVLCNLPERVTFLIKLEIFCSSVYYHGAGSRLQVFLIASQESVSC